jgi:hypothetical protein
VTRDLAAQDTTLRLVAFEVVASTPDGVPVYSIADIIEPRRRYYRDCLRSARLVAGARGYVLAGPVNLDWDEFKAAARRLDGLYSMPRRSMFA